MGLYISRLNHKVNLDSINIVLFLLLNLYKLSCTGISNNDEWKTKYNMQNEWYISVKYESDNAIGKSKLIPCIE